MAERGRVSTIARKCCPFRKCCPLLRPRRAIPIIGFTLPRRRTRRGRGRTLVSTTPSSTRFFPAVNKRVSDTLPTSFAVEKRRFSHAEKTKWCVGLGAPLTDPGMEPGAASRRITRVALFHLLRCNRHCSGLCRLRNILPKCLSL